MGVGWLAASQVLASSFHRLGGDPRMAAYWNGYFALMGWVAAATILPASVQAKPLLKVRWRAPALGCGAVAGAGWLAAAYMQNLRAGFYLGLLDNLAWLVLVLAWFRLPQLGIQAATVVILLLVGLPVVDQFIAPPPKLQPQVELSRRSFSYAAARKDPVAFARWWECFLEEANRMANDVLVFTGGRPAFRLRANGGTHFFESSVAINSKGFRGREIPTEKGMAYRIVALGESTTFGYTLRAGDKPWPELLEALIRERLRPPRPVEVINAGVPGYSLRDNVDRLEQDILPLQPDLIVSYHGFNGFGLLIPSLPSPIGTTPPVFQARPLNLLAACEYRMKMLLFRRSRIPKGGHGPPKVRDVMETEFAKAYHQLARAAEAKGIRLAIANFSLAINDHSPRDLRDFYGCTFGAVEWTMKANEAHSRLVREVARQHPYVLQIDTQRSLDGQHERFIDMVHFTQEGRQQLAEIMFAGIRELLAQDLKPANFSGQAR